MPLRLFISSSGQLYPRIINSHRITARVQTVERVEKIHFDSLQSFIESLIYDRRLSAQSITALDFTHSHICDIGISALCGNIAHLPNLIELDISYTGFTSLSEEFLYKALINSSVVYLNAQGNACDGDLLNKLVLEKDSILYAKFDKLSKDCEKALSERFVHHLNLATKCLNGIDTVSKEEIAEVVHCKTAIKYLFSNDDYIVSQKYPSTFYNLNRPDLAASFESNLTGLSKYDKSRE